MKAEGRSDYSATAGLTPGPNPDVVSLMSTLPDPPEYQTLENIPDAVGKFRAIGCSLVIGGDNYTGGVDTDAGGRRLSRDLRELERDPIRDRLTTLARLEELYNYALQCQYQNTLPTTKPKGKCRLVVRFSPDDGSIESYDFNR